MSTPTVDVAVLQLADVPWEGEGELPAPVFARVDRSRSGMLADCEAIGYPMFQRVPEKGWHTVELHGVINQTDEAEVGRLLLRTPALGGISAPDPTQQQGTRCRGWER